MKEDVYEYAMHGVGLQPQEDGEDDGISQLDRLEAWIRTLPEDLEQESVLYTVDRYDGKGAVATFVKHSRLTEKQTRAVDAQNPSFRKRLSRAKRASVAIGLGSFAEMERESMKAEALRNHLARAFSQPQL